MDKLWKCVMRLNARAFCLAAALFFFGVTGWCGFRIMTPVAPLKDGNEGKSPELAQPWSFGTLALVSNQLASETLAIPVDPFRPTIEAIFTNETERTAFLKALKAAQGGAAEGDSEAGAAKKEDPFAHLRKKDPSQGGPLGPNGRPLVIPKLTFMGFFERPDGKKAAMFYDSANETTRFYETGKQVHGVDVVNADVRAAEIRLPDGSVRKMEIGSTIELVAEPDARPPKKPAPAEAKAPAAQQRAAGKGPGQPKNAQNPGARPAPQKPGKPGANPARANRPPNAKRPQPPAAEL